MSRFFVLLFLVAAATQGLPRGAHAAQQIAGTPIDEGYRGQFHKCDTADIFEGVQFPIRNASGKIVWFGCKSDPSRFTRFERIEKKADAPEAVILESKLAHDEDGSPKACSGAKGPTDQCGTTLMLDPSPENPCVLRTPSGKSCVPLNADAVPYVVMPEAAPRGIDAKKFMRLSHLSVGDYGVVIHGDKVIPVIIGDTGTSYKIGEGSTFLLKSLSEDGKAHTFSQGVVFVLFPGTADKRASLKLETLPARIKARGQELFDRMKGSP